MCTKGEINESDTAVSRLRGNEVRMTKPYFFDIVSEIEKPTELVPNFKSSKGYVEKSFNFLTKPSRLKRRDSVGNWKSSWRGMYLTRIIFRFCKMDASELQEDRFPSGLSVQMNHQHIALPPCAAPIDVTTHVHKSSRVPNRVVVSWKAQPNSKTKFCMAICVAQKVPPEEVVQKIVCRPPLKAEFTENMIKKLLDGEADCRITDSLRASLRCPLRLARMQIPIRSSHCTHLQCFDAASYLSLNELRSSWRCPLCGVPAPLDSLVVDEYFRNVLASPQLEDASEIELYEDGSWTPLKNANTRNNEVDNCASV